MSLSDAVYRTVHEFPPARGMGSVETAALHIGKAVGTTYNKADPGNDDADLYLREAVLLIRASGDARILHAFNEACDHAAVPLGDFRGTSDMELLDLLVKEQEAAGEKAAAVREALQDKLITAGELETVELRVHQQIRAQLELLSRLKGMANGQ